MILSMHIMFKECMIKKLSWLITIRYILGSRGDRNISIMLFICFAGIFIGAFALALVIAVMNGFEKATYEKLQGIHAQIIMRAGNQKLDAQKIGDILAKEFPEVEAFSPNALKQVIIQRLDSEDISNVIALKAVDAQAEEQTSSLAKKIIQSEDGKNQLTTSLSDNRIIIGKKLAEVLNLKPSDQVRLLYIQEEKTKGKKVVLAEQTATIGALF
jgi:ABC-type lipoprotein release transport system permease subunit